MKASKQKKLEAAGWRFGTVAEFLELSEVEERIVELRLALADALKERRILRHLSQKDVADAIGSSQSRVAKIEAADPSVSVDLLLRGLFATGATMRDVAMALRQDAKPARVKRAS